MKKLLLTLTLFVLLWLIQPAYAQDEFTAADMRELAQRVVLIGIIEDGELVGNGSGTIVTSTGLIFTNNHVVEDADDLAIYVLDDIAELPTLRYFASVVATSTQIDFAIIQIDRDADGNSVSPNWLSLPHIDLDGTTADIGDEVRVFGYPGIGDGYMVVTSGEIVTIQNGMVNGERVPIWYRTDTEFSGGNSGGLAINHSGQIVGIPTWVVTEEETSGKLGGILPINTVLAVVQVENLSGDGPLLYEDIVVSDGYSIFTLENDSEQTICYVYISEISASSWGEDWLDESEVIRPGGAYDWELQAGFYDILLKDCDGNELSDSRSIDLNQSDSLVYSDEGMGSAISVNQGVITITCGDSEFDGLELFINGVRSGEDYRVTVVGMDGFDPIMAIFNDSDEGTCSDDYEDAATYKASLPTTGEVVASERSPQISFSRDSGSDSGDFSLVVGGYDNASGDFIIIVEGGSITADDGEGDTILFNLSSGIVEAGRPITIYALSTDGVLDPMLIATDSEGTTLNDLRGNPISCDDAGKPDLCITSINVLSSSSVSLGRGQLPGGPLDAALTLSPDQLKSLARQGSTLNILVTSYDKSNTGEYVLVIHMANG